MISSYKFCFNVISLISKVESFLLLNELFCSNQAKREEIKKETSGKWKYFIAFVKAGFELNRKKRKERQKENL